MHWYMNYIQPDSPYVLAHPGSLPDFLKQYENVKQFGESFVELSSVLASYCFFDISAQELKGSFPDLDYSHIIDGYFPKVINYTPSSSKKYGTALAGLLSHVDKKNLIRIRENPYIHIAAAAFWRVTGNLDEAFECYRTGIIYAEKASFSTTSDTAEQLSLYTIYIATATLLNRANLPEYSLALLDHNFGKDARPGIPHSACVLFMVQSATADASAIGESSNDENKSVISPLPFISIIRVNKYSPAMLYYSQALKTEELIPIFEKEQMPQHSHLVEKIWRKMRAMICQMDIIVELEQQKDNLEKLVTEKLYFNEVYGDQIRVEEQIRRRMISDENRRYLKLSYEEAKYGYNPCKFLMITSLTNLNNTNNINNIMKFRPCMSCNYRQTISMNNTVWRIAELFTRDRLYDKKVESLRDKKIDGLHLSKRYPLNRNRFWRRPDWPNNIDCQSIISRSDLLSPKWFPQIFISPENKGFLISDYLTLFIGLDSNDEHPLPWNEPYCDNIQDMNQEQFSFISNMLIALNKERKNEWAEPRLKSILVRLADRIMEDIEIGQRINTLLTNNIGPRWIALNLAGLYWRVVGNPRQAILCLVDAILNEPKFSDIALVQLAQVVLRVSGNKHEATKLLLKARDIDHEELGGYHPLRHSSKSTVSSLHPTVWCSPAIQNAVCFKKRQTHREQCYVVDPEDERNRRLIYNRCNGVYTGVSYKTPPYVNIVSPFLPIFKTVRIVCENYNKLLSVFKRDNPFIDDAGGVQTIETEELPLDYGGSEVRNFLKNNSLSHMY
uniref:TPR_REGION domain-containing protein n=1 Tax=Heterorhabditis bacteriophora TaxID=37862 RepID=A0A1I7W9R2_HETBA